jgi:hypothetical protein
LINGGKPMRGLDLQSPQTKFTLMRKLYEVKEQNNSSEEDNIEDDEGEVAGSQFSLYRPGGESTEQFNVQFNPSQPVELRAVNDFSRLYINEEDAEDEESDSDNFQPIGQNSKPISLISPARSFNS